MSTKHRTSAQEPTVTAEQHRAAAERDTLRLRLEAALPKHGIHTSTARHASLLVTNGVTDIEVDAKGKITGRHNGRWFFGVDNLAQTIAKHEDFAILTTESLIARGVVKAETSEKASSAHAYKNDPNRPFGGGSDGTQPSPTELLAIGLRRGIADGPTRIGGIVQHPMADPPPPKNAA